MDPKNLPKFVYLHKNHKYRLKLGFYAAPSNPKTFSKAVRDELNKLKFTYCTELNGLVMGFGKISSNELIPADIRHSISVAVNVDVYIFRPPVGSIIEAIVNQTSENHVSCLVHNLFNVSIVRPEHQPYSQWSGSKIKKDDQINVKVLSFDLAKKLPHITGEIVENKNDEFYSCKNKQKNDSAKYSSSSEESDSSLTKSIKYIKTQDPIRSSEQSSSDSESSNKMNSMRETHSKRYFDKQTKLSSQANHTDINNYSKLIKSPLGSSTPVSNSEHSVGSIDLIRTKQLKQLHKHLAKNVVNKQKSAGLIKSNHNFKKDVSSSIDVFLSSNLIDNKCEFPIVSISNTDYSDDANNLNSPDNIQSDSGISNDERRQIKSPFSNYLMSISKASPKSIKKPNNSEKIVSKILNSLSPSKVKLGAKPTNSNVYFDPNTDYSNKCKENTVYTQHMIKQDKNSTNTQSIHNLVDSDDSDKDSNNKYRSPNKLRFNQLKLSTGSVKPNDSPRKVELKSESVNKNDILKLQSNSMFSMISDVDSSSSETIELCVPYTNNKVEFNKETENNTISILPESKRSISTSQNTSSSDDEIYTKLKQNISNVESTKPHEKKNQNLDSVYSSGSESDLSSVNDASNLKIIKSNMSPVKTVNMLVSDKDTISIDNNLLPYNKSKNKRKQLNEKILLPQSSKCSSNKNKLISNLYNNENYANETIKQILKDSSCNDSMNLKLSNIKSASSISNSEERIIKPTLNKDFSNPFIKLCSANSTSSSSEDEAFINNLKINHTSKKSSTPLLAKDDKKNTLIQKFLTSIKCKDEKNEQKLTTHNIYSSSSEVDKFAIVNELKKKESMGKNNSNKDVLKCFKNPIGEASLSSINISQKSSQLQLQIKSSMDDSDDDEIDFLKNILEKRKLIKSQELESTLKQNNSENFSEPAKPIEKLDKKLKSQNVSAIKTNELINKTSKSKTKQLEDTKSLPLYSITDTKELSSIVQNYNLPNSNKVSETFEKVHKKSKSQNSSLDKTNELFNIIKTKNSKDLILEKVLSSFDDSFNSMKNSNSIQSNVLNKPSDKKNKKSNAQTVPTVIVNESINNTIKKKKKKSKDTKNSLVDNIINSLDLSSTKKNHNPTQLSKISEKKNEKSKPQQKPSMIKTHELINNNMKAKQKKSKKNKELLLNPSVRSTKDSSIEFNNSTPLNTVSKILEKNKKCKSPIASKILTDQLGSDTLKTKHKEFKDLFIDSLTSYVDNSTQLKKLSETHRKKNKSSKFQKSLVTDNLVTNPLKTKEEKLKVSNHSFSHSLDKGITDSSKIQNKKRSKDCLINSMTDFPDNGILSKKKKKDHYLITDETNENKLKMKNSVNLSKVCKKKKKKKEFNKYDINYSTVKDCTTSSIEMEKKEENTFIDDRKKNKIKMLPNDSIQHVTHKNTVKIIKTNDELEDTNPKKPKSIKTKSKKLSMNQLQNFLSSQNDHLMTGLDKLYHSFHANSN